MLCKHFSVHSKWSCALGNFLEKFFPSIFDLWLVETLDAEPADTEGRLNRSSRGPSWPRARHVASSEPVSDQSQHICPSVQPQAAKRMVGLPPGLPVTNPADTLWNGQRKEDTGQDQSAVKETNSTSAGRETKMDISSYRSSSQACKQETQDVWQRNLEASLSQNGGKGLRQKDAEGEEGTRAKPSGRSNSPKCLGAWQFQRIKSWKLRQIQKGAEQTARQWEDTCSTVQVLRQEGKSCSHHSWWVFCEEIRHLILIISHVWNCSTLSTILPFFIFLYIYNTEFWQVLTKAYRGHGQTLTSLTD